MAEYKFRNKISWEFCYLLGKRLIAYCRLQKIVVKLRKNNS